MSFGYVYIKIPQELLQVVDVIFEKEESGMNHEPKESCKDGEGE